ncbi:hypothetical protein ES702_01950 [subsurface metagenome]
MKKVRVFCPVCQGGDNSIWIGSLWEWGKELEKENPPDWANYAHRHEKAHGHQIMVEYPSGLTVPFKLSSEVKR